LKLRACFVPCLPRINGARSLKLRRRFSGSFLNQRICTAAADRTPVDPAGRLPTAKAHLVAPGSPRNPFRGSLGLDILPNPVGTVVGRGSSRKPRFNLAPTAR
jgi:hypothetical protein